MREGVDVAVHDAVGTDYHPADEAAIGSVHEVAGVNVHVPDPVLPPGVRTARRGRGLLRGPRGADPLGAVRGRRPPRRRRAKRALRGFATAGHYRRVADPFADFRTVPGVDAGRIGADYGESHSRPAFLEALPGRGVGVAVGSDSHEPDQVRRRTPPIGDLLERRGVDPASPVR